MHGRNPDAEMEPRLYGLAGLRRDGAASRGRLAGRPGLGGYCSVEFESFAYHDRVLGGDTEEAAKLSFHQVQRLLKTTSRGKAAGSQHRAPSADL